MASISIGSIYGFLKSQHDGYITKNDIDTLEVGHVKTFIESGHPKQKLLRVRL